MTISSFQILLRVCLIEQIFNPNRQITTAFKVFDEKELFDIVMEPEPGGELLDKVVKVYENETIMVEETANLFVKTGKSSVDNISSLNKENDETSLS